MGKVCAGVGAAAVVVVLAALVLNLGETDNPFSQVGRMRGLLRKEYGQDNNTVAEQYLVSFPPRWVQHLAFQFFNFWENVRAACVPAELRLAEKVAGMWAAKCLFVAVKLRIPEAIPLPSLEGEEEEWVTATEVAKKVEAHDEELLYRFLRTLAALGILRESEGRRFSHTEYSILMNSNYRGSARGRGAVFTWGYQSYPWDWLDHQIKTGENAFLQYSDGLDLWEYYSQRPEEERQFQLMLAEVSNLLLPSVVKQFSQSSFVDKNASITIVDVGGGLGGMLSLLLGEMPHAKGVLFDQESVIEQARNSDIWNHSKAERVTFEAGNFFFKVPQGDLYIMRSILHDWPDETSVQILKNIREAITPSGKLLVIEQLLPPEGQRSPTLGILTELVDLHMMVTLNGKERTAEQFKAILTESGFHMVAVHTTRTMFHFIEAIPKQE